MFDTITENDSSNVARPTPLDELRAFADEHRSAMLDAAGLLGGTSGVCLAQSVLDGLAEEGVPSHRTMRAIDTLLGILMLEHVHDASRAEAACFAAIDPASSCVEEVCLLADGLSEALIAYRDASNATAADFAELVAE